MPFQSLGLSAIPKRQAPERTWDRDAAAALLLTVTTPIEGSDETPTATDGTAYDSEKLARAEANKAKRLLGHVLPDDMIVKTATFGLDRKGQPVLAAEGAGKFGFAVYLASAPVVAETPTA